MKARIERDELRRALKTVVPALGRTSLPVLNGVRIEAMHNVVDLCCSDLQLTIHAQAPAEIEEGGVLVVPARLLAGFIDRAPSGFVAIEQDEEVLRVNASDAVAELRTMDVDGWPRITQPEGVEHRLTARHVDLIGRILPFAAVVEKRDYLNGLHVKDSHASTTDSYRMGRATLQGLHLPEAVIPAPAVAAALKAAAGEDLSIIVGERAVTFRTDRASWTTVLMEGDYPPLERLVRASSPSAITFDTERLTEALGRVGIVTGTDEKGYRPAVRINVLGDKAVLSQRADVGSVEDVVPCEGDFDGELGFNPGYLAQMLAAAGSERVTIGLVDHLKPAQVEVEDLVLVLMTTKPALVAK